MGHTLRNTPFSETTSVVLVVDAKLGKVPHDELGRARSWAKDMSSCDTVEGVALRAESRQIVMSLANKLRLVQLFVAYTKHSTT